MFLQFLNESREMDALYKEFMVKASDATKQAKHRAWADAASLVKKSTSLTDLEARLLKRAEGQPTAHRVVYDEAQRMTRWKIK